MVDYTIPNTRNRVNRNGETSVTCKSSMGPKAIQKEINPSSVVFGDVFQLKPGGNTGGTPSISLVPSSVRLTRVRGNCRLGHKSSSISSITPVPEFPSTCDAKYLTPSKGVPHLQVASLYPSVDDRGNNCPETPSSATGDIFTVTVQTSPLELKKRLE